MNRIVTSIVVFASAAALLCGAEFKLTDNGKAASSIILRKNASDIEKHAAKELSVFLGKISGGEKPVIGIAPVKGKYPIYLELTDDKRVGEEGFKIIAKKDALRITGKEPVGVLYGVYEVLKKDGGIWWLLPGKDGEYFTVKPTITVKEGERIKNPDFAYRSLSGVCMNSGSVTMDTWDWGVRNNMRFRLGYRTGKGIPEKMRERGIISKVGGHCYTTMMTGWVVNVPKGVKYKDHVDNLFKEHPEYFPLINGKRKVTYYMGNEPQPCTSNKEVIKRIAENIILWVKRAEKLSGGARVDIDFGSNDSVEWCECEKCVALDPPGERKVGKKSTRNWIFTNEVAKEIRKKLPGMKIWGWSYANFTPVPTGVSLSSDVGGVMLANHYRCWKHALDDKNCVTNGKYLDYNGSWNKMGRPLFSYEELIRAGNLFLPVEKEWAETMKFYAKNMKNFAGTVTEVCCPDGTYSSVFKNYNNLNNWVMMWQAMYMGMAFHWDVNGDIEAIYEKINSLYYGKGWEGGMKEFRKYLHSLYINAGGCWGFGHSTPVGKFLDVPGAKEKLYKYLASAEKAAAKDPDKRALAHVKKVKEYFERTWVKAYNDYISNFREIKAYPLKGKIIIDGKLDEADWKNADGVTRFRKAYSQNNELAAFQTSVKTAYDKKYFYIGVECLEEDVKNLKETVKEFDGPVWNDNGVEFFLNDPIMGGTYYQICVNSKGVYCDGIVVPGKSFDKRYNSNAEIRTSKAKDRYFIEMKIPASKLTGSDLLAGSMIRMNVFRVRVPSTGKGKKEHSTWSIGTPHNVETFHAVNLASQRSLNSNSKEVDARAWSNSSFNEVSRKKKLPKGWKTKSTKVPASWSFASAKGYIGSFEYQTHPGSSSNYYLTFSDGYIFNSCRLKSPVIAATCRLRGKGTLHFSMLRYTAKWRGLPTKFLHKISVDTKGKWETFRFEFPRPGTLDENHIFMIQTREKGTKFDLDDMYLVARDNN